MGSFADIAGDLIRIYYHLTFENGRQQYLQTSGIPFFQQLEVLFPNHHDNKRVAELFESRKLSAFLSEELPEKTHETLGWLRRKGIKTAISSNNFEHLVSEFCRRENISVDAALGFRPGFAKGTPHFSFLKDQFGIGFQQMMFVGDSLKDADLAKENGIRFVARLGTFSKEDFVSHNAGQPIESVHEIYEIVELLESS